MNLELLRVGHPSGPEVMRATVTGRFESVVEAERALAALRALGVAAEDLSIESAPRSGANSGAVAQVPPPDGPIEEQALGKGPAPKGTNVGGGAATGATLGGLAGLLWGWISASTVANVPGAVATVSAGILSSSIAALGIGAAVGALVGALIGAGMPALEPPQETEKERAATSREPHIVVVQTSGDGVGPVREALAAQGATEIADGGSALLPIPRSEIEDPNLAEREVSSMSGPEDESMGRDPEAVTGTKDAIDPYTGALGTGGTPMTTGYGVSGSTIGTGSARGQEEQESGDFKGSMPDLAAYERGGRGSTAAPDRGMTHDSPVESRHVEAREDEAPVQSEPETRDIYERGPSYATPADAVSDAKATGNYAPESDNAPPANSNLEDVSTHESRGTNIAGTSDVRGLGDNTDK